jgi:DNA-binding response OmpR family regulator
MPMNIVYLDDEVDLLEMFSDLIASPEIHVKTFTEPAKAIESIQSQPPDLIILDFRLPGTTGDEVALKLNPDIPKALITGDLNVTTKAKFDRVFAKPYSVIEMQAFVDSYRSQKSPSKTGT